MTRFASGLAAAALFAGLGVAAAQQTQKPQQAPAEATPPAGATQPSTEGGTPPAAGGQLQQQQDQAEKAMQSKSGQAGKDEPGSYAPSEKPMDTAVLVNGKLTAPGAPQDSQTVPSKYSERNAALDKLPMLADRPPASERTGSRE